MDANPGASPADLARRLRAAETKAERLFETARDRGFFRAGVTESALSQQMFELAFELFGTKRHWHKRVVRAGENTLLHYKFNPPDRVIAADDILFLDLGPVFGADEADFGRTYALGDDPLQHRLCTDLEACWRDGRAFFEAHRETITGAQLYDFTEKRVAQDGWSFGGPHCGHLIGEFPHERIQGDQVVNYLHPDNPRRLAEPDAQGRPRHWIYEMHLVHPQARIGGFFEQLLTV